MDSLINKLINKNIDGYIRLEDSLQTELPRFKSRLTLKNGEDYFFSVKKNEYSVDAEVLISYIYRKLGIDSPECFPAYLKGVYGVIYKNNFAKMQNNIVTAGDLSNNGVNIDSIDSVISLDKESIVENAVNKYIKMSISDRAFSIYDRYNANVLWKMNNKRQLVAPSPINNSCPAFTVNDRDLIKFIDAYNGVSEPMQMRVDYLKDLKSFDFNNHLSPKRFINILAKIDIDKYASEISEKFGYKFKKKFIDHLKWSLNDFLNDYEKTNNG